MIKNNNKVPLDTHVYILNKQMVSMDGLKIFVEERCYQCGTMKKSEIWKDTGEKVSPDTYLPGSAVHIFHNLERCVFYDKIPVIEEKMNKPLDITKKIS